MFNLTKNGGIFMLTRSFFLSILAGLVMALFTIPAVAWVDGSRVTTIRLGYYNPKDTKSGLLIGVNLSTAVDENVDFGLSVDFFHRSYKQEREVADTVSAGGVIEHTIVRELEFTTTAVPIMASLTLKLNSQLPFTYFFGGGLGYELLFNKENNYETQISDTRFYHGFCWELQGGVMYRLGRRSWLIAEVLYHDAHVKRNRKKTEAGLPIWDEVNLSGLGFRFGVRMGGY